MKIVIGTDGSEFSRRALEQACELAKRWGEVSFRVIAVYEPQAPVAAEPYGLSPEYFEQLDRYARNRAEDNARDAAELINGKFPDGSVTVNTEVTLGRPARVIVEAAENWPADMIIVGSHGHGFWGRLALGSVSDAILHHAPCSVLIVRDPGAKARD